MGTSVRHIHKIYMSTQSTCSVLLLWWCCQSVSMTTAKYHIRKQLIHLSSAVSHTFDTRASLLRDLNADRLWEVMLEDGGNLWCLIDELQSVMFKCVKGTSWVHLKHIMCLTLVRFDCLKMFTDSFLWIDFTGVCHSDLWAVTESPAGINRTPVEMIIEEHFETWCL